MTARQRYCEADPCELRLAPQVGNSLRVYLEAP